MQIIIAMVKRTVFLRNPLPQRARRWRKKTTANIYTTCISISANKTRRGKKNCWTRPKPKACSQPSDVAMFARPPPRSAYAAFNIQRANVLGPQRLMLASTKAYSDSQHQLGGSAQSSSLPFPQPTLYNVRDFYRSVGWKIFFSRLRLPLKHTRNSRSLV
jgi:hypothetical protein